MKNLFIVLAFATLVSCNSNSPKLSGEWRSDKGTTIVISQEDNKYFVKISGSDFMGKFEEDKIKIESPLGDIKYSKEKDRLYFGGEEFARKEFLEAEAKRIQTDKESFNSLWKKVPHDGGEFLSDIIVIELMNNGRFKINERNSYFEFGSEFRNIKYEDEIITGTFYFAIDNEHEINFIIKKSDENTIVYKDENREETFKRYIETDNFTGKWKGEQLTFVISKEIDKYRVIVTNEGIQGSPTDNLVCKFYDGKIQYPGQDKDFYKYQRPTIEVLPNGNLMYRDGAADIELKRAN